MCKFLQKKNPAYTMYAGFFNKNCLLNLGKNTGYGFGVNRDGGGLNPAQQT